MNESKMFFWMYIFIFIALLILFLFVVIPPLNVPVVFLWMLGNFSGACILFHYSASKKRGKK